MRSSLRCLALGPVGAVIACSLVACGDDASDVPPTTGETPSATSTAPAADGPATTGGAETVVPGTGASGDTRPIDSMMAPDTAAGSSLPPEGTSP